MRLPAATRTGEVGTFGHPEVPIGLEHVLSIGVLRGAGYPGLSRGGTASRIPSRRQPCREASLITGLIIEASSAMASAIADVRS
jgi:hypothetical protein